MKTLYISDLDGTLLNSNAEISDYTAKVINNLTDNGLNFTIATARSVYSLNRVTKGLNLKLPVIVNNGTLIQDPNSKEVLVKNIFLNADKSYCIEIFKSFNFLPFVYSFFGEEPKISYINQNLNESMSAYVTDHTKDNRMRECFNEADLYNNESFYYTGIGKFEVLKPICDKLRENPKIIVNFQKEIYRDEYWLEVMSKNASKAHGITKLKELLKVDRIVCFGDSNNDIPMFSVCDKSIAVENAIPEVLKEADEIISKNTDDGVAKWLLNNI